MGYSVMETNFIISNKVEELSRLAEQVDALAENWNLPMPLCMNINLVLEEAVSNIIFYAFKDDAKHDIEIFIALKNDQLKMEIVDDGIPFNPSKSEQPDISLPVEERPVGGLGILLISKIMDEILYIREDNKNKLILMKNLQV